MTIKGMEKRLRESFMYKNIFRPIKLKLWREPYYKFIKDPYRKYRESRYTDEEYFLRRHKNIFGYIPDFKNPQTFNEKIVHRILYDRNPLYTALADKLKARIYIAAKLQSFTLDNGGGGSQYRFAT